jgi:hypothetical protein
LETVSGAYPSPAQPRLRDLDLEVRNGVLVTDLIDQDDLLARLDELRERGCRIVSVVRQRSECQ